MHDATVAIWLHLDTLGFFICCSEAECQPQEIPAVFMRNNPTGTSALTEKPESEALYDCNILLDLACLGTGMTCWFCLRELSCLGGDGITPAPPLRNIRREVTRGFEVM